MHRSFYTLLLYLLVPFVLLRLIWRARKVPAHWQRWAERFGLCQTLPTDQPVIWLHAVSVGEVIASVPLVQQLLQHYPNHRCLVTTTTLTGANRVIALYGNRVNHCYCPYDLPDAYCRFLKRVHPVIAIIVETELWPNMLAACYQRQIPVIIANARLSERSAKGYSRPIMRCLTRALMQHITVVACQNDNDGQRFLKLGLPADRLQVIGSIKFDMAIPPAALASGQRLRATWEQGLGKPVQIWIAASTHANEEQRILATYQHIRQHHDNLLLVLVPRHPERFDAVFALIKQQALNAIRYSQATHTTPDTHVILGDTLGDLLMFYRAADVAFVGGSLVPVGGHNLLEPAALGLPVLAGPHLFNFQQISEALAKVGGLTIVQDTQALTTAVSALLADPTYCAAIGSKAQQFVAANRGAVDKLMAIITAQLNRSPQTAQ